MIHPLLRLIATQPELLADHVGAYASLIGHEARQMQQRLVWRGILFAVSLAALGVAVVLAGVSVMLWSITPSEQLQLSWVLWATPLVPAVVAVVSLLMARRPLASTSWANLQAQLDADARMLHDIKATS